MDNANVTEVPSLQSGIYNVLKIWQMVKKVIAYIPPRPTYLQKSLVEIE